IRLATPNDLEAIIDFDELLYAHQQAPPSFSELTTPPREELRSETEELWGENTGYVPFLAECDGSAVGFLLLYPRPTGDLRVPEQNIDLSFAATRNDVRGTGVGLALTAHAMNWAHTNGFRS